MEKYPEDILNLQSFEGFRDRYYGYLSDSDNYKDAYETTENEYETYYGKRKYKNYDSFRVTLSKNM